MTLGLNIIPRVIIICVSAPKRSSSFIQKWRTLISAPCSHLKINFVVFAGLFSPLCFSISYIWDFVCVGVCLDADLPAEIGPGTWLDVSVGNECDGVCWDDERRAA